jgi:energy-coupling factor transporter ATP-binding protein EcfA2
MINFKLIPMAEYDFSTLSATNLEDLVCDLLNSDQPENSIIRYKTFKEGKDKGIDFLYSTSSKRYEHIGQVKHYLGSGYKGLLSTLKNTEVSKAKLLNPSKYILATSVDLSVANTEEIQALFKPFIENLNDIYGKQDLNRLIGQYPQVLKKHFKLWFSDSNVLQKLLNSNLEFRSVSFIEKEIKKRVRIYVETPAFVNARESLAKNRYIVVTGEPGVGKTTLAEMLSYEYIKDDYELIYVYDSIKDADIALSSDDSKQVIYYDDFLGSNKVEINKAKGSDTLLNKILKRVKQYKNKVLILTTRKHLLNSAIAESEKLRRFNIQAGENVLHLDEYKPDIREELFRNHIEVSELPDNYKQILLNQDLFEFIINHKHFNPRSVEFITTKETVAETCLKDFSSFIRESFDYPSEIWKHAYLNQISEDDRILINTLFSFGLKNISIDRLQLAFDARLDYEVKHNNKERIMFAFRNSYDRLLGGFIFSNKWGDIQFINPSVEDFLLKYIRLDPTEINKMVLSVSDIEQLTTRMFSLDIPKSSEPIMPFELQKKLLESYETFLFGENRDGELIQMALVIHRYVKSKEKDNIIIEVLSKIKYWTDLHENYELSLRFQDFMNEVSDNRLISNFIENKIIEIVAEIIFSINDFDEAYDVLTNLATRYNINFALSDSYEIKNHFENIINEFISDEVYRLQEYIENEYEADDLEGKVNQMTDKLNLLGLYTEVDIDEITGTDWDGIAMSNQVQRMMQEDD